MTTEGIQPHSGDDALQRIHRQWKAKCEALGYDVDGNRQAVWAAIDAKQQASNARTASASDRSRPRDG